MNLQINHIRKGYDGRTVLEDCTFSFPEGRITVLMGPNGCGKSTLLRICSLLERSDGGGLRVLDRDLPLDADIGLRRRITLVLPRTGVFNTTVFNNVAFGLQVRGASRSGLKPHVQKALALVGLDHKAGQHARTLSSGETQRMGIARALAIEPEILFLDEPTASVDEENTVLIESVIREMRKAGTSTIILTTHDRDQADRLADRMLFLSKGMLTER